MITGSNERQERKREKGRNKMMKNESGDNLIFLTIILSGNVFILEKITFS